MTSEAYFSKMSVTSATTSHVDDVIHTSTSPTDDVMNTSTSLLNDVTRGVTSGTAPEGCIHFDWRLMEFVPWDNPQMLMNAGKI
jgi:hypothetical protein